LAVDIGGGTPTDSPRALIYANKWKEAALKKNKNEDGKLGFGLYSAINPSDSFSFGSKSPADRTIHNADFVLVTVKYPKGGRVLDLRATCLDRIPISKVAYNMLKDKCGLGNALEGDLLCVDKKFLTENPFCASVYEKAISKLNLDGMIYSWNPFFKMLAPQIPCDNYKGLNPAFVALNLNLSKDNVEVFTKQNFSKLSPEDLKKYNYVTKFLGDTTFTNDKSWDDARDKVNPAPTSEELTRFKKENFGCSKEYDKEDSPTTGNPAEVVKLVTGILQEVKDAGQAAKPCDENLEKPKQ